VKHQKGKQFLHLANSSFRFIAMVRLAQDPWKILNIIIPC
jgi:hypothetical protein